MKKLFFVIILLTFSATEFFAHGQGTHQHMVREAYKLLKSFLGQDVFDMIDHVGYNEQGSDIYNPGGSLVIGVYREDEEDATYYASGLGGYNVTNSHFWNADMGDNDTFDYLGISYPNAYEKAITYFYGDYVMVIPGSNPSTENGKLKVNKLNGDELLIYPDGPYGGFYFSYASLAELYKTRKLHTELVGKNAMYNVTTGSYEWYYGNVIISAELRDRLVWELLGRTCHLLGDMSMPAHSHKDIHWPDLDSYEEYMNYSGAYNNWTFQNAVAQGGLINATSHSTPLKYLFYSTVQISNYFGSDDYDGNSDDGYNLPFSNYPGLPGMIASMNSVYGGPTPHTFIPLTGISNFAFVYGIRSVAGLLHLFAYEAGLLPKPITGASIFGTYYMYTEGVGRWSAQPLNGIAPFTYNWQIYKVGDLISLSKVGDVIDALPPDTWVGIGTNSPTLVMDPPSNGDYRDFKLRCIITDATSTTKTSNEHYVYVHSTPPPQGGQSKESDENILLKTTVEKVETLPREYSLEQNYPNPFNPSTIITYSLPQNEFVTLKVYDILGKEITTLVYETKSAGKYSVEFDASNLPSGTYIYKLTSGNYSISKKMSFIK